ncbi:hypothetical protein V5R04_01055 [Jonesiaceae bacterium BS-20]|uniref:Uncharacterized protein n=1 Tax=Jonesiaceae bacterium BS-20 TaxID=3120821 RepID=A0AAU7DX54_9MICO
MMEPNQTQDTANPGASNAGVMSAAAIAKATERTWAQWRKLLDANGAATLAHKPLAELALAHIPKVGNPGWWAQSIAIAYEQETGVRVPGQLSDGTFAANASRTLTGTMDEVLARWQAHVGEPEALNGAPITQPPETSSTEKWRYWRCTVNGFQRINVTINTKPGGKVTLAVQHPGLGSLEEREEWKTFWRTFLKSIPA